MLYERNQIVEIKEENNKKGIYSSFPCEEDNTYDYLLLDDISNIVFLPEFIQSYKNNRYEKVCISFSTRYDTNDPENMQLIATTNNIEGNAVSIELQTVIDKLCSSAYEMEEFDEYKEINDLKANAINEIVSKLFIEQGILMDSNYGFMGRIIDKKNNIVGIIDSFNIDITDPTYITIELNNVVAYFALKDIDVKAIEFPTGQYMLKIDDFEIETSDDGLLRHYVLKTKIAIVEENNTQQLIGTKSKNIIDEEAFFDDISKLLTAKEEIFNQDNMEDSISDLFDDFDL